jgi:hypothetical protein
MEGTESRDLAKTTLAKNVSIYENLPNFHVQPILSQNSRKK